MVRISTLSQKCRADLYHAVCVARCHLLGRWPSLASVKARLIISLLALLVAGCTILKETDHQPELTGRYTEPLDPDLNDVYELVGREEFEFFPDGTAISLWIFGSKLRNLLLKDLPAQLPIPPVVTERRNAKKVYVLKTKGTWRVKGNKIVYQDDGMPAEPPLVDFFLATFNPKAPRASLSERHVFAIDTNGDLLRIPPRGHPYYAGRFIKQR